jgi:2-desacetyl-2-hydroxyethyl bacteriochlorophyllide A dehydrogenase
MSEPARTRALWFTAPRAAELRSEPIERPARTEVQVDAIYSLVSAGSEMNVYRGQVGSAAEVALPTVAGTFPFPIKYGYQVVGKIVAAGEDSGFRAGERVFCQHPHQERFTIEARVPLVFRLPPECPPIKAAFSSLYRTALNCLIDVPVRVGECVAVSGLGIVGSFCAQLARKTAHKLLLIDPAPRRRELAEWIGADAVVTPEGAPEAVHELSDGRGMDVFIEASGAPAALQTALRSIAIEGTIAAVAWYGTREVPLTLTPEFHFRRPRIVSSWVGMIGWGQQARWTPERQREVALAAVRELDVERLVTHTFPFSEAPRAYALINSHPDETLAVLLDYEALNT